MNERIQELSNLAKEKVPAGIDTDAWIALYNREFADLIEKEVEAKHFSAGYLAGQSDGIKDTVKQCLFLCDQVDLVGADDCIDNIKQHYGVDE